MDNSTTFDYQLSQFGSWYLLAGIECYAEAAMETCQCETLLLELDRLEAWEQENGGYYSYEYVPARFAELRERITERLADIEAYDAQYYAERARSEFTVIEGGKKN
jgi:hypothetical protein